MLAQVLADLSLGAGAIAQVEQRLLVRTLPGIVGSQRGQLLFSQLLSHAEPDGDDASQAEGILSVQVNVHPVRVALLGFDGSDLSH